MRKGALLLGLLAAACGDATPSSGPTKSTSSRPTAAPTASGVASASASPRKWAALPPDSPAPVASLAHQGEAIVSDVRKRLGWPAAWDDRARRGLLLEALSQSLAQGGFSGSVRDRLAASENADLKQAAVDAWSLHERTNAFPGFLADAIDEHVDVVAGEARRGMWAPGTGDAPAFDAAAVFAYFRRRDPVYLRELLAARAAGVGAWSDTTRHPYLRSERACLEVLRALTSLTADEAMRLEELSSPKLKEPFVVGRIRFVIEGAEARDSIAGPLGAEQPADGGMFVIYRYTMENLSGETTPIGSDHAVLTDAASRRFTQSVKGRTALAMSGARDVVVGELQPGLKTPATAVFEIPKEALRGVTTLRLADDGKVVGFRSAWGAP